MDIFYHEKFHGQYLFINFKKNSKIPNSGRRFAPNWMMRRVLWGGTGFRFFFGKTMHSAVKKSEKTVEKSPLFHRKERDPEGGTDKKHRCRSSRWNVQG